MITETTEFYDQETVEMADGLSGFLGARLTRYLDEHVESNNLGWVFNADTDFELPGIGKCRPDGAFCSFETLAELPRTVVPVPPYLAIEIASSRDEIDNTDKKLNEYQAARIRLVWVVRPVKQVVEVYRSDGTASIITTREILRGEDVVKGFELPLAKLFALPAKPVTPLKNGG